MSKQREHKNYEERTTVFGPCERRKSEVRCQLISVENGVARPNQAIKQFS